jgi:hypothetical protein
MKAKDDRKKKIGDVLLITAVWVILSFIVGIILGVVVEQVFPWMIGNAEHAIQTKSFAWNAEQASSDTAFVVRIMKYLVALGSDQIALWFALIVGLPFGLLVSLSPETSSDAKLDQGGATSQGQGGVSGDSDVQSKTEQ